MGARAALVTGGSSGIGLAIARMLGEEGYGVTLSARRPEKLEEAAEGLRGEGVDVEAVPANMANEEDILKLVERHRERFGRLDVLVNNAGVGIGSAIGEFATKKLDMQIDVNLRAIVIATRESVPMLKEAAAENGSAHLINTASIAGKSGHGWLSVYSATKFGVVGFTQAMHRELSNDGIKATALCPGFVDTAMTDWLKGQVSPEEMIQPQDIAEAVRYLLHTSPGCFVPEIQFIRPGEGL